MLIAKDLDTVQGVRLGVRWGKEGVRIHLNGRVQRGGGSTKTVEQKVTEEAIVGRQKRRNVRGMFVKGMERFF